MKPFCSLILALVANAGITFSPAPSSKAKFIECSTRLSMEVNLEEYLGQPCLFFKEPELNTPQLINKP